MGIESSLPEGNLQSDNQEHEAPQPLFPLGQIVGTPGAMEAMQEAQQNPLELLYRHVTGDWGELDEEDKAENDLSVQRGFRILSAYHLATEVKIWLITEADRSVTTFLLPEDY
jgi:hypothetical protein